MIKRLWILVLLLTLFATPAWARQKYVNEARDTRGNVIGGVTVTVYETGTTTLASIYSDNAGTSKTNPFTSDTTTGVFWFYAGPGTYDIRLAKTGYTFSSTNYAGIRFDDLSDALPKYAEASVPAAGTEGRIVWLDDGPQGLLGDFGSYWAHLAGYNWIASTYATLGAALTAIGSSTATLVVQKSLTLSSNTTIPNNVTLTRSGQGSISIDSGVTLTLHGPLKVGGTEPFFTGAGTVTGEGAHHRNVRHFGARGDTVSATTCAITAATASLVCPSGTFDTVTSATKAILVKGAGASASAPSAPSLALVAGGSNLDAAQYYYRVQTWTRGGHTTVSSSATVTTNAGNRKVDITVPACASPCLYIQIFRTAGGEADSVANYKWIASSLGGTTFRDDTVDERRGHVITNTDTSATDLVTTITSCASTTTCTIGSNASTTVSSGRIEFGTSDLAAFQRAVRGLQDNSTLYLPTGRYWIDPSCTTACVSTDVLRLDANNVAITGDGEGSVFYIPYWRQHNHGTSTTGYINLGWGNTFSGLAITRLHVVGEHAYDTPKLDPQGSTDKALWVITAGDGTTANPPSYVTISRNIFEKLAGETVKINAGNNNHTTGPVGRGHHIDDNVIANSVGGTVGFISGGHADFTIHRNTFYKLGSLPIEVASRGGSVAYNVANYLSSGFISIDNVTTQEGWLDVHDNMSDYTDTGDSSWTGNVNSPLYGVGQLAAYWVQIRNNVGKRQFGAGIYTAATFTDLLVTGNDIESGYAGSTIYNYQSIGSSTACYTVHNGTRITVTNNICRISNAAGASVDFGFTYGGSVATDTWADNNLVLGPGTAATRPFSGSVVNSGDSGVGTRTFLGASNWVNDGTVIRPVAPGSSAGTETVPSFTSGATPSVALSYVWRLAHSGGTTITGFTNATQGRQYTFYCGTTNATIQSNPAGKMYLKGDFSCATYVTDANAPAITLAYGLDGNGALAWTEIARTITDVQAVTCTDNGAGTNQAVTITPSHPNQTIQITNSDANGCDVTVGETGAASGWRAMFMVVSSAGGTVNFADTAGVTELTGAIALGATDTLTLGYANSAWHQLATSNN